jgi:hypothetical protein
MTARCLRPPTGPAADAATFNAACVPVLETERLGATRDPHAEAALYAENGEPIHVWRHAPVNAGGAA